ncbi:PREDICTED: CUB and sushi domain-containing protein 3-like, partial [Branchiostoma belcheri]|uniref:CUB and sushi domain-containing protein 3-like n=1 Tax=Branchiostoma belcheri TaxID=7741 RepID=A0A6P4YDA0_BRABE
QTVVTFTCDSGYTLNGAATPTCQADGTWSSPVPTCQAAQCPARAAPANGAVSPTGAVSYPNGVTFTCNPGYTLNGAATPTCQADGTWSNPIPTCQAVQCPARAAPANGAVSPTGAVSYPNGVTFTCDSGYTLNGVATLTCQADGTWSNPVPTCQAVQCPARAAPANGAVSPTGAVSYPNGVTFTCNPGYTLNGAATPTCQADTTWSNPVPSCTPRPCPALTAPTNGALSPLGPHAFPTVVTFTCNPGYVRSGAADTTCRADGTRSNPVPTCTVGQCSTLTAPANGAISTTATSYNTVVTFTCNSGYVLNGATSTTCQANGAVSPTGTVPYPNGVTFTCNTGYTLNGVTAPTCQADGTWSSPVPTCTRKTTVQCSALTAPANGAVSPTGAVSYPNGVTFTCNPGYTLNGVATPTCQADGTWNSPVPTCQTRTCPARPAPANGAVSPTGAVSYPNGVTFTCNPGYTLDGAATPTCQADGTWFSPVPTCTPTGAVSFPNGVTFTCNPGYTLNGVAAATCQADGTWSNPVPTCQAGNCDRLVREGWDIVFLMDSTSSVKFGSVKNLTRDIADRLLTDGGNTRVGVVQFSDNPAAIFDLNTYNTKSAVITAINAAQRRSGGTFAGSALTYVKEVSFSTANGGRAEWPDALIVVTDGMTFDDISYASQAVREQGITTFAVGAGDAVNRQALRVMAVDPYKVRIVTNDTQHVETVAAIWRWFCLADVCTRPANPANGIRRGTIYQGERMYFSCDDNFVLDGTTPLTCTGTFSSSTGSWSNTVPTCKPACTPNPCLNGGVCYPTPSGYQCQCPPGIFGRNCGTGSGLDRLNGPGWDLVFLLDSSDSVGMPGFLKVRNVTEKIVERLPLRNNETHIGLAQYSDQTKQESLLKNYQNKNATLEKIQGIMPLAGATSF